jgi:hypothetical protein
MLASMTITTILINAFSPDRANRDGALALSHDLLMTLQQRIGIEVSAYLSPLSASFASYVTRCAAVSAVLHARDDPQAIGDVGYGRPWENCALRNAHALADARATRTALGWLVHPSGATSRSAQGRHGLP